MTDVLKIPEAAKALGCTEACAQAMAESRRIPAKIEAEMEKSNVALCGATFGEIGLPGRNLGIGT